METKLEIFGKQIRHARIQRGFTQADLSRRSGVSVNTISQLERNGQAGMAVVMAVLEAMDLADALLAALPKPEPTPLEALAAQRPTRQRVRHRKQATPPDEAAWQWGGPDVPEAGAP